jgi:hypothetical protein
MLDRQFFRPLDGGAVRPFSNGGKRSNEKPSNKDAACISGQSQPEPSNQMSQVLS